LIQISSYLRGNLRFYVTGGWDHSLVIWKLTRIHITNRPSWILKLRLLFWLHSLKLGLTLVRWLKWQALLGLWSRFWIKLFRERILIKLLRILIIALKLRKLILWCFRLWEKCFKLLIWSWYGWICWGINRKFILKRSSLIRGYFC
jgi:hypothetical protein